MVLKVRCTGVEPAKHIGCKGVLRDGLEKNGALSPTLGTVVGRSWLARYVGVYFRDGPPRVPSHRASNPGLREKRQLITAGHTRSYSSRRNSLSRLKTSCGIHFVDRPPSAVQRLLSRKCNPRLRTPFLLRHSPSYAQGILERARCSSSS
jgi:hypothetical protein